jgi:multidrug efflux pump subunit AcrA (membrane-fusion protein)
METAGGDEGNLTLTHIITNGTLVKAGDPLAEFDRTNLIQAARDAEAKYEDLAHQVEEKAAQNHSDTEKRNSDLQQAQADLDKAELEVRKGPILSDIDRLKNEVKLADAREHVKSLTRSNHLKDISAAADLRILELKRDRQKLAWDRAKSNADQLLLRAPIGGMVALGVVWRHGSFGHPQEGDQLWDGEPLAVIFDRSHMEVDAELNEADGAMLAPATVAIVHLDAYPAVVVKGHFAMASPAATVNPGNSIHSFAATFVIDQDDPLLMPDLSAGVDIDLPTSGEGPMLPRSAVHYRDGRAYVTVVDAGGTRSERQVELSGFDDTHAQIASGVRAGDRVAIGRAEIPAGTRGDVE